MSRPRRIFQETEKNLIVALYEIGKTDKQIAKVMHLPRRTFTDALKYNELAAIIKEAKGTADDKVEASLYAKALKGDVAAIVMWLGNRQPDEWKNLNRVEHMGKINLASLFDALDKKLRKQTDATGGKTPKKKNGKKK